MPTSHLAWRAFRLPKAGHTLDECEDACAANLEASRFAIADGASESSYAADLAQLLVAAYVHNPGAWSRWLPEVRRQWQAQAVGPDLPWYAEAKLQEGAFATLLGLAFANGTGSWQAQAVGDSCLFQVRGGRLRRAFPVRCAAEFSNQPTLLGSRPVLLRQGRTVRGRCRGKWREGDSMLLATDALAEWFMQEVEQGRHPWRALLALQNADDFADWVARQRERRALRNDDVTLVCIRPNV